jgi:hypothetical protein
MISGVVAVSILGTMFTNGFVTYPLAIMITFLYIIFSEPLKDMNDNVFITLLTMSCLYLVAPPTAILLSIALGLTLFKRIKIFKNGKISLAISDYQILISCLFFAMLFYFISNKTVTKYGWQQINEHGLIHPMNYISMFLLSLLTLYVMFRDKAWSSFKLIVLAGLLSLIVFTTINWLSTGTIQYYGIKQAYLVAVFEVVYVTRFIVKEIVDKIYFKAFLTVGLVCILVIPILNPPFPTGFMGTVPNVVIHTFDRKNWIFDYVNADLILKIDSRTKQNTQCVVFKYGVRDSDLNSRWVNALKYDSKLDDVCFNWGQVANSSSLEELSERLEDSNERITLVVGQSQKLPEFPVNVAVVRINGRY